MDAIAYIRWSTEDQSRGDSERRQLELARQHCDRLGWLLVETVIESGKSAYHGKNRVEGGKLNELEKRAARGELAGMALVTENLDRLSRQFPTEGTELLTKLVKQGITVVECSSGHSWTPQTIQDRWLDVLAAFIKAGVAYEASYEKSKRVKASWRMTQDGARTKKSGRTSVDPRICPAWMSVIDGEYVVDEERADVIRHAFQMVLEGIGLRSIAVALNKDAENTRWTKGLWSASNLSVLLRSRKALGEYQPKTVNERGRRIACGEWRPMYPAILDKETWLRAQAALDLKVKTTGGRRSREMVNVLQGIVRCGHFADDPDKACGGRMTLLSADNRRRSLKRRLVCGHYHRGNGCSSNKTYSYDPLLWGVIDNVLHLSLDEPVVLSTTEQAIAVAEVELAEAQTRLDALADRIMLSDDETLERAYARFKQRVERSKHDLKQLKSGFEGVIAKRPTAALMAEIQSLRERLPTDASARQRVNLALKQLVSSIYLIPENGEAWVELLGGVQWINLDRDGRLVESVDMSTDDEVMTEARSHSPARALALARYVERRSSTIGE